MYLVKLNIVRIFEPRTTSNKQLKNKIMKNDKVYFNINPNADMLDQLFVKMKREEFDSYHELFANDKREEFKSAGKRLQRRKKYNYQEVVGFTKTTLIN